MHLFEAAIDLLSYATLLKAQGKDYKSENLLSLSGVYQPKKESKDSKIPIALSVFLEKNPLIKTCLLYTSSNSMVELYTIQRYLQYRTLQDHDWQHFDAWASMFGETVTAVELTPEGKQYNPSFHRKYS